MVRYRCLQFLNGDKPEISQILLLATEKLEKAFVVMSAPTYHAAKDIRPTNGTHRH